MSAIACTILQICQQGDQIISSRTIYGGTYAFFKIFYQIWNTTVKFVDIANLNDVDKNINSKASLFIVNLLVILYLVADIPSLSKIAKKKCNQISC